MPQVRVSVVPGHQPSGGGLFGPERACTVVGVQGLAGSRRGTIGRSVFKRSRPTGGLMYGHPSMCLTHARALAPSARVFYAWLATRQADLFPELLAAVRESPTAQSTTLAGLSASNTCRSLPNWQKVASYPQIPNRS